MGKLLWALWKCYAAIKMFNIQLMLEQTIYSHLYRRKINENKDFTYICYHTINGNKKGAYNPAGCVDYEIFYSHL